MSPSGDVAVAARSQPRRRLGLVGPRHLEQVFRALVTNAADASVCAQALSITSVDLGDGSGPSAPMTNALIYRTIDGGVVVWLHDLDPGLRPGVFTFLVSDFHG
jgi:hypothetical protein